MPTLLKALLRTVAALIACAIVVTAALPWMLSADWVQARFLQAVNSQIEGSIEIEEISLSWLSGQQMTGIVVKDPEGDTVLEIPSLNAETSVWSLLSSTPSLGHIELQSPTVRVVEQSDGMTTLQLAFGAVAKGHETLSKEPAAEQEAPALKEEEAKTVQASSPEKRHPQHQSVPLFGSLAIVDGDIEVVRADSSTYNLHDIGLSVALKASRGGATRLAFEFQCEGLSEGSSQGTVLITGEVSNITDRDGYLSGDNLDLTATATLNDVRIMELVTSLGLPSDQQQKVAAFVGDTLDLTTRVTYSKGVGGFIVDYKGDNSTVSASIRIDDDVITLDRDLIVTMIVNPTLSKLVLKDVNPLLLTAVRSEHPIRVQVQADGFSTPITPFALQAIDMPRATLDFGKVTLTNGGTVQEVLSLLRAQGVGANSEMTAWFTPQYVSLSGGVVTIERLDVLLADTFHIATWGSVNLLADQMRATVGLTAQALKKAFGLKRIADSQMLQIEVRGSTSKPKVNTGKALTQIAQLVGQETTGEVGTLIGDILDATGSDPLSRKVPAATTSPFPWESDAALMTKLEQPGESVVPDGANSQESDTLKDAEDYLKKKAKELWKRL